MGQTQLCQQAAAPVALGDGERMGLSAHLATAEEQRSSWGKRGWGKRGCTAQPNTPKNSRGKAEALLTRPCPLEGVHISQLL